MTFSVPGQKTLVAGRDRVTITAYDPRFLGVVDHDDDHDDDHDVDHDDDHDDMIMMMIIVMIMVMIMVMIILW